MPNEIALNMVKIYLICENKYKSNELNTTKF